MRNNSQHHPARWPRIGRVDAALRGAALRPQTTSDIAPEPAMDMQFDPTPDPQALAALPPDGPAPDVATMLRDWLGDGQAGPSLLEQRFPHVIRRIEALWGSDAIHPFLDALTPAGDSPSQGFPPEVEAEIRRFRSAYRSLHPAPVEEQPAPAEVAPEAPAAPDIQLDDDYDIWKSERQRRGWAERSVF
jgi:hypothetical protein